MQTEIIPRLTAGVRKSVVRLDEQFSLRDAPLFHTRMIWHFDHNLNVVVCFYAAVKCQNESSASWTCFLDLLLLLLRRMGLPHILPPRHYQARYEGLL